MTADLGNVTYLVADTRVTAGSTIVSDHNQKIFLRKKDKTNPVNRYYITLGEVGPCDYLVELLDKVKTYKELLTLVYEDEAFSKLKCDIEIFIVRELKGKLSIYQVGRADDSTWTCVEHSMVELESNMIASGSGGMPVKAAMLALQDTLKYTDINIDDYHDEDESIEIVYYPTSEEFEGMIRRAFKAAAKVEATINANLNIYKILNK